MVIASAIGGGIIGFALGTLFGAAFVAITIWLIRSEIDHVK